MPKEPDIGRLVDADGEALAAIFLAWRSNPPSMASLVEAATSYFKISDKEKYLAEVFNAAAAADTPLDNPYHNNHHFREVTAAMISLIHAHNKFFEPMLDARDICKCLIAAAVHDLAHTGNPNTKAFENEQLAVAELIKIVHLDMEDFEDIKTMVLLTDISPHKNSDVSVLPPKKRKLRIISQMLLDADIVPSTATTYAFNKKMSALLSQEIQTVRPTAQSFLDFIDSAIGENYKSPAARKIYGPSLQLMRKHAQKQL